MKMNILLLSVLALVSADDFLKLPIFRNSTKVTVATKDGSNGVTFNGESLYANIYIDSVPHTTHLEPESGDIWIFEDEHNEDLRKPHAPTEENLERLGLKYDTGMYYVDKVEFDRARFMMPYAVINRALSGDNSEIGGLGLGPQNTPTFGFPMVNQESRNHYINFADGIKSTFTNTDAFTINLATYPSHDDNLVYGAMDISRYTGMLKALHRSPSTKLINAEFTINGYRTNASLAIDDPNTYLDDEVVDKVAKDFGAKWDDNYGLYMLSTMPQKEVVLNFDDVQIRVPPADVWVQDKRVNENWYFTVRPRSTYSTILPKAATLGADILNSAYIVYDLGHDRAAIGKAVRNPGEAFYVTIPNEGIPKKYLS